MIEFWQIYKERECLDIHRHMHMSGVLKRLSILPARSPSAESELMGRAQP